MIRLLIALFPRHFRDRYGNDMRDVFHDQLAAARSSGRRLAVVKLWMRTSARMFTAALREHRGTRRVPGSTAVLDYFRYDVRLTGRALLRTPLFTAITIGVIAIGIGAVATIFSSLNALVLRPIPGTSNGEQLFTIDRRTADHAEGVSISGALYRHLRTSTRSLDGVAVWSRVQLSMATGRQNIGLSGAIVSPNYFDVLGIRPAAGRFFTHDEARPVVVISHGFWLRYFSAAADVGGQIVTLNGRPYTVVGVAPEGFRGVFTPLRMDAWVPLSAQPHVRPGRDLAHAPWLWMFGRVPDHLTPDQARTELTTILGHWTASDGADQYKRYSVFRFTPLTGLPDDARRALLGFGGLLLGAAILVLIVAGANVSTLLALRATSRRHEMGLRTALGAGRAQLVRQLMTETLVLFLAGSAGGLLLAWAGTSALEQLKLPGDAGLILELSPDLRVVGVAAAVGLLSGLIFGLGPALRGTRHNPVLLIRSTTAGAGTRRGFATSALLVAQLAASLVLLSTTTLFVRALAHGAAIDPGFDRTNVAYMPFNTESFGYDATESAAFYSTLRTRVQNIGGVTALGYGQAGPLLAQTSGSTVTVARPEGDERLSVEQTLVGEGYFPTLGITLVEGRGLDTRDAAAAVAVVSESFARRAWPDQSQVTGLTFRRGERTVTVVGVARDVIFGDLGKPGTPFVYYPLDDNQAIKMLFVRTAPGSVRLDAAIAGIVRAMDPAVPVPPLFQLSEESAVALMPQRVAATVTSVLGGGALLLACAGLYGAIAYLVTARTREIGVRMALGATPREVVRVFMVDGLRLTSVAVVIGLAGSVGAAQLVSGFLLGRSSFDPGAFGIAAVLLIIIAAIATFAPARRAAAVDPARSLRGNLHA